MYRLDAGGYGLLVPALEHVAERPIRLDYKVTSNFQGSNGGFSN